MLYISANRRAEDVTGKLNTILSRLNTILSMLYY